MTGLRVSGMDHIVLNVADIERSIAFYSEVLGLAPERVEEWRKGEVGFPSLRIDESTIIDLFAAKEPLIAEGLTRNLNHYCLVTDEVDFPAFIAELNRRGVPIMGEVSSRWGARGRAQSLNILDPDGNQIEIRCY